MATISIRRFIRVLPVPVTALSQTVATDIQSTPILTMRITGIASAVKESSRPKTLRNISGKRLSKRQRKKVKVKLSAIIFLISGCTLSFLPWPIILLTIALLVLAKDHTNMPNNPKIFRIVLLIANGRSPLFSIRT